MDTTITTHSRPNRRAVMHQRWDDLLFLHWRVAPGSISPHLPPGLSLDTFEGAAHVGLVAFRMNRVRPSFLPTLPWLSNFLELNVRLYVLNEQGEPGIYFLSLDCNRAPAVLIARTFFSIPYQHARMSFSEQNGEQSLECRRLGRSDFAHYIWRAPNSVAPAVPGTLEHHLVERYNFFTLRHRTLACGQVYHEPYKIGVPDLLQSSNAPLAWDGLSFITTPPDLMHYSPGVSVEAFALR
jgi:uncharacterized protein YqjF (DUF2071 family)